MEWRQFKEAKNIRKQWLLKGLEQFDATRVQKVSNDETGLHRSTLANLTKRKQCWKGIGWLTKSLYLSPRNMNLILKTIKNLLESALVIFRFEIIHLGDFEGWIYWRPGGAFWW